MKSYDELPLVVAHLLGGANGVDLKRDLSTEEIERRVRVAIQYADEIQRQLEQRASRSSDRFLKPAYGMFAKASGA